MTVHEEGQQECDAAYSAENTIYAPAKPTVEGCLNSFKKEVTTM